MRAHKICIYILNRKQSYGIYVYVPIDPATAHAHIAVIPIFEFKRYKCDFKGSNLLITKDLKCNTSFFMKRYAP